MKSFKTEGLWRGVILSAGVVAALASCQQNELVYDYEVRPAQGHTQTIEFGNYIGGMTRSSRTSGNSFRMNDSIEVYGFMKTGEMVDYLFDKQAVYNTGDVIWDYNPKKFWNVGSEYEFYSIYPYSLERNSFDAENKLFRVTDFTVSPEADSQTDLMLAQRILNASANNVVNFVFNHMLSNVSFYVKTSSQFDTNGIASVQVIKFDVKGLYGKGSFSQTGWNDNNGFTGQWIADEASLYNMPTVTGITYNIGDEGVHGLAVDHMLLPQTISSDAVIEIVYRLIYEDGTSTTFTKNARLNKIVGSNGSKSKVLNMWEPNYRYNYMVSIDPSKKVIIPNAKDDNDQDDFDGPDPDTTPNVNIIPIDDDGDGIPDVYWVDDDLDGNPDYPTIWEDIDGDGKQEVIPDRDGDGLPDDTDGDGNPDVIWIDTDGDGEVDTELEREVVTGPDVITDPDDPGYPDTPFIDYNGGVDDYLVPSGYLVEDEDGELWIDTDGDGKGDIQILWKDIDGDGNLEGVADRDGDGILTPADSYDGDGVDYEGNPNDYDVIMVDTDGDGVADTELERKVETTPIPEPKVEPSSIDFSANVNEWDDEYDAQYTFTGSGE